MYYNKQMHTLEGEKPWRRALNAVWDTKDNFREEIDTWGWGLKNEQELSKSEEDYSKKVNDELNNMSFDIMLLGIIDVQ